MPEFLPSLFHLSTKLDLAAKKVSGQAVDFKLAQQYLSVSYTGI
jgi:hypothetical protein